MCVCKTKLDTQMKHLFKNELNGMAPGSVPGKDFFVPNVGCTEKENGLFGRLGYQV